MGINNLFLGSTQQTKYTVGFKAWDVIGKVYMPAHDGSLLCKKPDSPGVICYKGCNRVESSRTVLHWRRGKYFTKRVDPEALGNETGDSAYFLKYSAPSIVMNSPILLKLITLIAGGNLDADHCKIT